MKVDKHGLKMIGLKRASGQTFDFGDYSPQYCEIFYNTKTGDVWTVYHYSVGRNSWSHPLDPAVEKICTTDRHMTMQEIADAIFGMMKYLADEEVYL